jgi:hypothetical protein
VTKNGIDSFLPGLEFTQDELFFINFAQMSCSKPKLGNLEKERFNGTPSIKESK